jgi:hypothetical protein
MHIRVLIMGYLLITRSLWGGGGGGGGGILSIDTILVVHEIHSRRRTWAPRGQYGWYIEPPLEHYRCYILYITKTWSAHIVETVEFFPT